MTTTVTFDEFPVGTQVTTQYAARGLLLGGERIASKSGVASRVLQAKDPADDVNPWQEVTIRFTSPMSRVQVGVLPGGGGNCSLKVFNAAGKLLQSDGPRAVNADLSRTVFSAGVPTAAIARAELGMSGSGLAIGEVECEGKALPDLPTTPPSILITSPTAHVEIGEDHGFAAKVHITGRVNGAGLMPTVTVKTLWPLPPDSNAPQVWEAPLSGSGNTRTFSIRPEVLLGPTSFTFSAANISGMTASARVTTTYVPTAIRRRFDQEGGARALGNVLYGATEKQVRVAIFERGAIALRRGTSPAANQTTAVRGATFDRWIAIRQRGTSLPTLGAPQTEQRPAPGETTAQDFTGGRIYAGLPSGAHYVPLVFSSAIDRLGGESETGLPTGDPTSSNGVLPTSLFQRFTRHDYPGLLSSTLEIRGNPPRLFVERQGGYVHELRNSGVRTRDLPPEVTTPHSSASRSPTIWYSYPCDDLNGPCEVAVPTSARPLRDPGGRFCGGTTYPFGAPQWSAVRGQHRSTSILGIVKASHPAANDNPLTHEHRFEGSSPIDFPSDWNVILHPLNPYRNLLGEGQNTFEIEFEAYYARHFFVRESAEPRQGDLLFASGRWIVDCGHDTYNTEIHPPFVLSRMRTVAYKGRQATAASIWVNGWFPGDPVEFDIYPPPRPTAEATLNLVKPVDRDSAIDIVVDAELAATGDHVTARFSASPRRVPVTDAGEMKWRPGRSYEGTWYVYWSSR